MIAQVVLEQLLHTFGCTQSLVPTTLNITLIDIVSSSKLNYNTGPIV